MPSNVDYSKIEDPAAREMAIHADAAQAMAAATGEGEKAPFDVRHPTTGVALRAIPLAALGTLLGSVGGAHLSGSTKDPTGVALGGAVGGLTGTGLGVYLAGKSRRNAMQEIGEKYDAALGEGRVTPRKPQFSGLAAALLPLRGPHRTGQLEGYEAVRGTPISAQRPRERNLLYAARHMPGPIGPLAGVAHGYGQNLRTQFA